MPLGPPPVGPPPGATPDDQPTFFAPPPRRRSPVAIVIASIAAVVVLVSAILIPVLLSKSRSGDETADAVTSASGSAAEGGTLEAVKTYDGLTNAHLAVGESTDYPQSPPVGGNHAPYWLECGAYDQEVPEVAAVHDLEHGTVWLTYRPDDVDATGVAMLTGLLPANGLLSPYAGQEAPVVITAWGRQLALTGPHDPRIAAFIEAFGAGDTAPEPFASCNGGVDPAQIPASGTQA